MNLLRITVLIAMVATLLIAGTSCDKMKGAMSNVKAKVAGQALDANGHGQGYITIELVPAAGGESLRTVAEDSGNFMFEDVTPGKYTLCAKISGGVVLPSDEPTVNVGPGRTVTQNLVVDRTKIEPKKGAARGNEG